MFIILRTLYLDDEAFREYSRPKYGARINEKAKSRTLQIWDVMSQYKENSYIRIYVEGYDEFTGRRLIFQSPDYTIDDIVPGKYPQIKKIAALKNHIWGL